MILHASRVPLVPVAVAKVEVRIIRAAFEQRGEISVAEDLRRQRPTA